MVATVVALDGGQFAGFVGVEVGLGDDAFAGLAGIHYRLGDPAFIETVGALGRDFLEGLGQVLLHQLLAYLHRLAVMQEDATHILVFFELTGGGVQQVDIALLQLKAVFRQLDRRGNHLGALEGAVFAQGQLHAGHRARYADRQMAFGAEALDHIAGLVEVHIGRRRQRGFFAEVEEGLAPVRQLHRHETATAQVARRRVHHRQCVTHCHRRIDRVAAGLEHIDPHMGCQVLGRDHHAIFTRNRGLGSCMHPVDR
ncbi:hypothetical protein PFLmoz3_02867 [Pseudomonas fluorescens]|uniref:Uncharacterized protein n=1 Tax=Pseudomonas fluorescens TaxID=294 RepID=A0A125QIG5_PSEFL|nr:hypothetical protein PFLmoz3_02867 [Pseudomonas fluorescens]